jgi:transposase
VSGDAQLLADGLERCSLAALRRSGGSCSTCRQLVEGEDHPWRFGETPGLEPTNNMAERALRHGVLWRKSSVGTASPWGSRFVSRLLGVVAKCRQQGRCVLGFLTSCLAARIRGQAVPKLC